MALEELDFSLVLFGGFAGFEGAEVAALSGFGVGFAGVEAIFAGFKFADHWVTSSGWRLLPGGRFLVAQAV